jgi:hypothetical protein
MKHASKPEDESDLTQLRDRLLLEITFLEDAQDFPSGSELREVVEAAAARKDKRSLRLIARDLDAMTNTLERHQRDALDALLKARLGVDKDFERATLRRHVADVIKRGTIASAKERQRLEEYADIIEIAGDHFAELKAVRQLLRSR